MSTKLTKEQNDFVIKFKNDIFTPSIMESIKDVIDNYKEKEFAEIDSDTVKILEDYIDEDLRFTEEDEKMISNVNVKKSIITSIFNLLSMKCQATFNKLQISNKNRRIYFDRLDWDSQIFIISKMKEYAKKVYLSMSSK